MTLQGIHASSRKRLITLLSVILLLALLTSIPLPYYIYQPGTIENLNALVQVQGGQPSRQGSFNLTTVLSSKANNALILLYGLLAKDSEIKHAEKVRGTLTDEQYGALLNHMMTTSQNNAVAAALAATGKPVALTYTGVFVQALYPESKAIGVLFPGDVIIEAEGMPVTNINELASVLVENKKAGDPFELVVLRNKEEINLQVELYEAAVTASDSKAGSIARIGIVSEDQYTLDTPVTIQYADSAIGGPSAGLMFSLEIIDQLTDGELTHGKFIAGTGTIDTQGNIGQIGGIEDKIIAAARAGVDIFFCPADVKNSDTNEKAVKEEARQRGFNDVTIVPVRTLDEALSYLKQLDE
ncbi:SepM family pheromone-processing serine protease [Paenibacillus paridis]|uniref:SepM family pheromone-processing serine protease n=1 Tax=Paenibacillus paridis TaxID=2583376 RepID=UPI001122DF0C|nr:SepM family pheromone-processing serine protease [Paenibacillus paridis]